MKTTWLARIHVSDRELSGLIVWIRLHGTRRSGATGRTRLIELAKMASANIQSLAARILHLRHA